jgi:hypothetical protein
LLVPAAERGFDLAGADAGRRGPSRRARTALPMSPVRWPAGLAKSARLGLLLSCVPVSTAACRC